jgi:NAD(P)H-hydrate epimerase
LLTGILTGCLAQNYSSLEAALIGVYLHGLSGDLAIKTKSMEALVATDLLDFLPEAFLMLHA